MKDAAAVPGVHRHALYTARARTRPPGMVERLPDSIGHRFERKAIEAVPHVAAGIAVLQTPHEKLIERSA